MIYSTGHSGKNLHGFTIIEVITVLVLICIISALVLSRVLSTNVHSLSSEVETLKTHLRYAQARAMSDEFSWKIDFTGNSYTLSRGDTPFILPNENSSTHTLTNGVPITTGAGSTLTFDTWGSPGEITITLTLSSGGSPPSIITITKNTGFIP